MYFKELEESYVGKTMKFIGASDIQVSFGGRNDPRKFFTVGEELVVEHAENSKMHRQSFHREAQIFFY